MDSSHPFFSFSDLSEGIALTLAEGIKTRAFLGEQAILSVFNFAPNSEGSIHPHPVEQWGVLLKGSGIRI